MGTESDPPVRKTGYRQRLGKGHPQGGVRVVVRERESRLHGEGEQGIGTTSKPEKRAMDLAHQADYAWVLSVQQKLYQWSQKHPTEAYRELWNWLTDLRNLREAWRRVAQNKGKHTPGTDGMSVGSIRQRIGEAPFLAMLQQQLKAGSYKPSPCRRKLIPKPGKPGKFRPLGIPTIADRPGRRCGGTKCHQTSNGTHSGSTLLACLLRLSAGKRLPWSAGTYSNEYASSKGE